MAGIVAAAATGTSLAADGAYPNKALRVIVPWPPGGGVDSGSRPVSAAMAASAGQPVVIENRAGAAGIIGTEYGARAAADGYTITAGSADTFALNPHVYRTLKYDPFKSFDPIAPIGSLPMALTLRTGSPANSLAELIKLAKDKPDSITYGSWGVGSLGHVGMVMLEESAGIRMLHVPYQGGSPAVAAIMANQIDLLITPLFLAVSQQNSGKVKILGITSGKRSSVYPDHPTLMELGIRDYAWDQWVGFYFPAKSPAVARDTIAKHVNLYLKSTAGAAQQKAMGFESPGGGPNELLEIAKADHQKWGRIVREKNISA
jgi:tripartite-type tricarboxylate transporter receptor subunit TctC